MNQPEGTQLKGRGLETVSCLPKNPFYGKVPYFTISNHPAYILMDIMNVLSSEMH